MLSVGPVVLAIRTLTIVCWLIVIYDAMPFWPYLPEAASRAVMAAAICGTVKYISGRNAKPAHEVYAAGKAMGRKELLLEQQNADAVVHLDDHRRLREVDTSAKVAGGGGFTDRVVASSRGRTWLGAAARR